MNFIFSQIVSVVKFKVRKFEGDQLIFVAMVREKPGGGGFHLSSEIGLSYSYMMRIV